MMKNSIYDRKYQEFSIGSLFDITRGNAKNIRDKGCGEIVLVSAIDNNNGFYQMVQHENEKIYSNVLTVNNNGNGVCLSYFHEYKFMASSDVSILLPKNNYLKKKEVGLFISCLIKKQKSKFNYGYKMNNIRMEKQKILLPVDDLGNPDYKFMEDFIKEREKNKREKYRQYVENKLKTLVENGNFRERELLNKKWGEFKVKDIFNINTGGDLIINKVKQGNIPVISHTALNNGVILYSDEILGRKKFSCKNTISLADRGNFKAFVQNQDFYVGTRVKALESKRKDIEQPALFFLSRVIDNQSIKFSYGHNACDNLGDLKIMLPITENEEIDYEFMENYMKYLMLRKYQKYLNYIG